MTVDSNSINPFPGLRSYRQDEDYLFFGREEQTMELLQRLGTHRLVAVVGTSGSGKSSLVRCGLLSELLGGKLLRAGASWEVAVTHPGGNPLALLAEAILEAGLYDRHKEHARENLLATLSRSHFGLVEAIRQARLSKSTNFLLVVDQFEEIFRFHEAGQSQQEIANEFVSLLLEAVAQSDVPIYVVLTMRSDFIGECGQFEGLAEMVNRGEYLIPRLSRDQFKRIIEAPIRVAGGQIAPRLLQRLLNDLGQQADQLPCLQHALMRTWSVWSQRGDAESLDLDDYQRVGRMSEALSLHADDIFNSLESDRQRELCAGLFKALTIQESENRGIRRPQRLGRLCQILEVSADELRTIIDAFRQSGVTFLMPSPEVELTDKTIVDISHESLMRGWTRLRNWTADEAQAVGIYRRLSESAALHEQQKAGLYRDPELSIALAWRDDQQPNLAWAEQYDPGFVRAMEFLYASRQVQFADEQAREAARQRELTQAQELAASRNLQLEQQRRSARRLRTMIAGLAAVASIAGVACAVALFANARATNLAKVAQRAQTETQQALTAVQEEKQRAELNLQKAQVAENEARSANAEIQRQSELAERNLYVSRIALANHHLKTADTVSAQRILAAAIPAQGETDRRGLEWDYLRHWSDSANRQFDEHHFAHALAFSPDGRLLATAGGGDPYYANPGNVATPGEVLVREMETGQVLHRLEQHSNIVAGLVFSPDGKTLISVGHDGVIVFTDVDSGRESRRIEEARNNEPRWVELSPDGKFLCVHWGNKTIGETAYSDAAVYLVGEARLLHQVYTTGATFDSDSTHLLWLKDGNVIQSLDLATLEESAAFSPLECPGTSWLLTRGRTGRLLAAGFGQQVLIWDLTTRQLIQQVTIGEPAELIAFNADDSLIAATGQSGVVRVYGVKNGIKAGTLLGNRTRVTGMAFSPDGRWLATTEFQGTVRIFKANQDSRGNSIGVREDQTCALALNDNGTTLHTVGWTTSQVGAWDANTGANRRLLASKVSKQRVWPRGDFAFSADGRRLAAPKESNPTLVMIWDATTGEELTSPIMHVGSISAVQFSPDGTRLATAWFTQSLFETTYAFQVWDCQTGACVVEAQSTDHDIQALRFSPDGRLLAAAGEAGPAGSCASIWDLDAAAARWHLEGRMSHIYGLSFSPDSSRLAAADYGRSQLQVWDVVQGIKLASVPAPRAAGDVAYSPDGTRLAVIGYEANVHLYDAATFDELLVLDTLAPPSGSLGFTPRLAFSSDGLRIAGNSPRGIVSVWCAEDALSDAHREDPQELIAAELTQQNNEIEAEPESTAPAACESPSSRP